MKMEEIKKLIQKAGPMRLGVVVICGVLLILFSSGVSFSGSGGNKETKEATAQEPDITARQTQYREKMKQELTEILRRVEGVGNVEVMLTLKASNEKVTLKDNTDRE